MRRYAIALTCLTCVLLGSAATSAAVPVQTRASIGARLTGAQEVPPADPDGAGKFGGFFDGTSNQVCYGLSVTNIAPSTAAHIHSGVAGVNGPIVVHLVAPAAGASGGCSTPMQNTTIQQIIDNPAAYYVNVHNSVYPGGAIRGQLG